MTQPPDLDQILERLLRGEATEDERELLRRSLRVEGNILQFVSQDGSSNINIAQITGGDVHIGNRYEGVDAKFIKEIIESALREKPNQSITINSDTDRLSKLKELQKRSRALCVCRFKAIISSLEMARELADDKSLGVSSDFSRLEPGKVFVFIGEFGIGKTLIAQRLYQKAIIEAINDSHCAIPIYLECNEWKQEQSLEKIVSLKAGSLGEPSVQGATIFIDGLDEVDSVIANKILEESYFLVESWDNTTLVITSRLIPCLENLDSKSRIQVPLLSEQQSYKLIERVSGREINAMIVSKWTNTIKDSIRRPLFALVIAEHLKENNHRAISF